MTAYESFIASRRPQVSPRGIEPPADLCSALLPHQRDSVEFALRVGRAALFLDCVAGETRIDTIAGPMRIDALARAGRSIIVRSLDSDGNERLALATAPFRKGIAKLYRVRTAGGRSITTTAGHRFLSDRGWVACGDLAAGSRLLVSDASRPRSSSGLCPPASPPDAGHSERTRPDFLVSCSPDLHRCGARLPLGGGDGLASSPSQDDAPAPAHLSLHEDDRERESAHSRRHPDSDRPSTPGLQRQGSYAAAGAEYRPFASATTLPVLSSQTSPRSDGDAIRPQSETADHLWGSQSPADGQFSPCSSLQLDTVVSVTYVRTDAYYDLHVPGYENYSAHGLWSHNTGLGKSLCSLEWARVVAAYSGLPVLILTPLAVAPQFVREGRKFGIGARHVREADEIGPGINVANYERLSRFDGIEFGGIVLDESSLLKSFAGKTRQALTARFADTRFRLACTATPAPNDYMELGNHAEFLGVMTGQDMLQRWFINDTAEASQEWRLKGHAVGDFWDWVCSWARCISSPADLGYDASAYVLPELREITHQVDGDLTANAGDALFRMAGVSATNMHAEQRLSLGARVERLAWLVAAEPAEPWIIWCETDEQADALRQAVPEAVEVRGSHPPEWKEDRLLAFGEGRARVLITKPKIAGHGLNWQHCARMGFVALSFSYEAYYQAVRRCWRFGQTRPVTAHLITSDGEAAIFAAVRRKAEQHDTMKVEMLAAVRRSQARESAVRRAYQATHRASVPAWLRTAV